MSPVLTRHAPEPVRTLRRAAPIVLGVALAAASALLLSLVARRATIDKVIVTNRAPEQVDVSVRPAGERGALFVATVDPGSSARIDDVLDQGDTWVVRAEHAGTTLGELRIPRRALERRAWHVTIPAGWGAQGAHST
jgi:hypothetical protein